MRFGRVTIFLVVAGCLLGLIQLIKRWSAGGDRTNKE